MSDGEPFEGKMGRLPVALSRESAHETDMESKIRTPLRSIEWAT